MRTTRMTMYLLCVCLCLGVNVAVFGQETYLLWTRTGTAEIPTMTIGFLEGANLRDGVTEHDATVLSLGVGTDMRRITDVILPNVPNLFTFSTLVTFHVEYRGSTAMIVSEPTVAQLAVEDTEANGLAFEEIQAATVAGLAWQAPTSITTTATQTIVFRRTDGTFFKIGQMTTNLTEGTMTFAYADITK